MKNIENEYLLDPSITFLNHGSYGACSKPVFEEFQRLQREMELNPVEFLGRRSASLLRRSREKLAAFVGTSASNMVFVNNATTAVNTVIRSIGLESGDEILSTNHEYGACDLAWEHACVHAGAKYIKYDIELPLIEPDELVDSFFNSVTNRTKLIYLSHITSSCALILPVEEICKRASALGIRVFIDGAHAPGHVPLDLDDLNVDFYTGNCHKWLSAPKSSAFLYAKPGRHEELDAVVISWGYADPIEPHIGYAGQETLERRHQWQGTRDIAACLAVPAAIDFQEANDWKSVFSNCHELALETRSRVNDFTGLDDIAPDEAFGQMIAISLPRCDGAALKNNLFDKYRIEIPVTDLGSHLFIRPSFNAYNSQADADLLVKALKELIGG